MVRRVIGWAVEIIAAFALMITVLPPIMNAIDPETGTFAHVLAAVIVTGGYIALVKYLARAPIGQRKLKLETAKFAEFYADWYARSGRIYIFCDDTDWLESDVSRPIVNALIAKGARATFFVREASGRALMELQANGVTVVPIPSSVAFRARLSLRVEDGKKDLIIRDTNLEGASRRSDQNVFRETSDPYLIGLAEDLLRSIKADVLL